MIALGGPKLKLKVLPLGLVEPKVSMIALGGPKLKPMDNINDSAFSRLVSMIALGGPKLKLRWRLKHHNIRGN